MTTEETKREEETCRKTSKNERGTMLSAVLDMFLNRSLSEAGSGVGDWSAGLLDVRLCGGSMEK